MTKIRFGERSYYRLVEGEMYSRVPLTTWAARRASWAAGMAFIVAVFVFVFAITTSTTPCAQAQSGTCQVGDEEVFSSSVGQQFGSPFTQSQTSSLTANRTITWPDASLTVVGESTSQTLTNKTLQSLTQDLAVTDGGTGASTAAAARANLGIGATLIATSTVSNVAAVDFTSGIDSTFPTYMFVWESVRPQTDNDLITIRTSTDGGATFDSGASDYRFTRIDATDGTAVGDSNGPGNSEIKVNVNGIGNATHESSSGVMYLRNPSNGAADTLFDIRSVAVTASGESAVSIVAGRRVAAEDVDAVRFAMNSGQIASGSFRLYGLAN